MQGNFIPKILKVPEPKPAPKPRAKACSKASSSGEHVQLFRMCMIARRVSKPNICTPPPFANTHPLQPPPPPPGDRHFHVFLVNMSCELAFLIEKKRNVVVVCVTHLL